MNQTKKNGKWKRKMEDEGLPFPGSDFFELITAYQTPPDA